MFAPESDYDDRGSRARSPEYGGGEGSYRRQSRSPPPRGGSYSSSNDLEHSDRSERDYDRNDSGNYGYNRGGRGGFRGRGNRGGPWRNNNYQSRDRDYHSRTQTGSNFRDRDRDRDRDRERDAAPVRRSPSPPRTFSGDKNRYRRENDKSPPPRGGDFTTRTFRAPEYDSPAPKNTRDTVGSPSASSYGVRRYSGPSNRSSSRSPERRSYDDREEPSWRRSSSALSDRDRDDYHSRSERSEPRNDRGDYYPRRGSSTGSYSSRTSYVPGSASSRDDYHTSRANTSSQDRASAQSDDMDLDDEDAPRSRAPREREEPSKEHIDPVVDTEPPAKRPRLNEPAPAVPLPTPYISTAPAPAAASAMPPTPAIQPQPVRTTLLAPAAPSTPVSAATDPRGLSPLPSPGLFQVYHGKSQPITAPMQAAIPPPPALAVPPPALSASTAEALAAAREQKQQIVHEMNGKDDEIAKLEKDIEQYRREMEKLGRELAGLTSSLSRGTSALSSSSESAVSSLRKSSTGAPLSESTGSLLAKFALSAANSEGRLQLMRSLGPIFAEGEQLDLSSVIVRKNRRTAFASRESLRERLLGPRGDESIAVNAVFDEIPEDPQAYEKQQESDALPPGKVARLYNQPRQLPFFDSNRQTHTRIKAQMLTMLRDRRKEAKDQEKALREQYRRQFIRWKRKLRQRRQDEASERMIEALHARGGNPRRFPVRSLRVAQQESDLKRRERQEKAKFTAYDDEEERFRRTEAKIPPMEIFDWRKGRGPVAMVHVVNNNRRVLDPARIEREYKSTHDWHPEEEAIFVKAYVKYPKDFEKIASFLPDKSVKDCIWFYYMSKFRLELKKRTQREGERNHIDLGLKSMEDPNDLTSLIAFGSVVDWTNGASRRGSLRLSEKGPINYSEKNMDIKLPPVGKPFPPGSPVGKGVADDDSYRSASPANVERVASPIHSAAAVEPTVSSPGIIDPAAAGRWTAAEREQFKTAWEKYHKDWKAIANFMKTKDVAQVKNFYHNNKKKLHLVDPPSSGASSRSSSVRNTGAAGQKSDASESEDENALLDVESDSNDANYGEVHVSSPAPSSPVRRGGATRGGRGGARASKGAAAVVEPPPPPVEDKEASLPSTPSSHWTDGEKQIFKDQFVKHGKDWKSIAEALPSKTANQVKNFYQNYRVKLNLDSLRRQALEAASSAESALASVKAEDESSAPSPSATPTPVLDTLMETAEKLDAASPAPVSRRGGSAKRARGRPGKVTGRGGKRVTVKEETADVPLASVVDSELRTSAAVSLGSGVVLRRELTGSMESLDVNIDDDGVLSRSATPVPPGAQPAAPAASPSPASGPTVVAPKPQRAVAAPEPTQTRSVSTRRNGSKRAKVVDDAGSTGSRSRRGTPNTSMVDDEDDGSGDDDDENPLGDDDRDQDFEAAGTDDTPTVAPKESVAARTKRRRKEKPAPASSAPDSAPEPTPTAPDDSEMMEVDVEDDENAKKSDKDSSSAMDVDSAGAAAEQKAD
eukprot:TRINITY_DN4629_c0_g2_i1.p1 TRINITY_DN4629_c0_g2~~TRINITY_DN4629_c0_g2_i1.p1  ORF type:complete len:1501 (+),score=359.06 TRINITY_DN4629_c0_g2_i1:166-4668(+)